MKSVVETFYDQFSRTFIRDYVIGNRRVDRQIAFFCDAIPRSVQRILVIGCGSGMAAKAVASWCRKARVLAIDLSEENLRLARALHAHPRVAYEHLDVTVDALDGRFDAILLPDVYEHIPVAARSHLHSSLALALTDQGRILITVPSPGKQASLAARGGLQIVDEVVSLDDIAHLARDVSGTLAYLNVVSIWEANDYMHAVVARDTAEVRPLSGDSKLPVTGWPDDVLARVRDASPVARVVRAVRAVYRYAALRRWFQDVNRGDRE